MLCQNCGKNEANVKYTQIINGVKKEMVLCEECSKKMGIGNMKINMPHIGLSNFLGDFFDDYDEVLSLPNFVKEKQNKCSNCGELYENFTNTGLLGCPECYDTFEEKLDSILKNLQGRTNHVGRKPINIEEKLNNIGENPKKIEKTENKKENNKQENKKEDELNNLKQELNKAIKEERYEDAATLRDKIKQIGG